MRLLLALCALLALCGGAAAAGTLSPADDLLEAGALGGDMGINNDQGAAAGADDAGAFGGDDAMADAAGLGGDDAPGAAEAEQQHAVEQQHQQQAASTQKQLQQQREDAHLLQQQNHGEATDMKPAEDAAGFGHDTVDEKTGAPLQLLKQFMQQHAKPEDQVPLEEMAKETYKPKIRTWNYAHGGVEWEEGMCAVGKRQSPIALDPLAVNASLHVGMPGSSHYLMHYNYTSHDGMRLVFNGHTLSVTGDLGWVETGCCQRTRYEVLSFHFHAPAGHTVLGPNGTVDRPPLELRIVHQDVNAKDKDGLLVLSVLFGVDPARKTDPSKFLASIDWDEAPSKVGVTHHIAAGVDLRLLEKVYNGDFVAYNGSLATPTCDEGVEWRVFDTRAHMSEAQVERVQELLVRQHSRYVTKEHGNYRVTQPRNGRSVVHYHRMQDKCHSQRVQDGDHCCRRHCCPTKTSPCADLSASGMTTFMVPAGFQNP